MTRKELQQRLVLISFCDDYEDIERITKSVGEDSRVCGIPMSHKDILERLSELIDLGYAKAWDLTRRPDPASQQVRDDIGSMDPGFARTEQGLAFVQTNSTIEPQDREQRMRHLILNSYGNCTHVPLWYIERLDVTTSRDEWIEAVRQLVSLGNLRADYKAECWQYPGMPPLEDIKPFGAYFWVTNAGWDFIESNPSWWPFYDYVLRKDCTPSA